MKQISSTPVIAAEAKRILSKREKDSELGYEQKIALDHLRLQDNVSKKDWDAATEELGTVDGIKDHQITMLIDNMPGDAEDVKVLFMKERMTIKDDQVKKILEALDKIRPTKK